MTPSEVESKMEDWGGSQIKVCTFYMQNNTVWLFQGSLKPLFSDQIEKEQYIRWSTSALNCLVGLQSLSQDLFPANLVKRYTVSWTNMVHSIWQRDENEI